MIPPRNSAGQTWRTALTLAVVIALAVGVVGTVAVLITTDVTLVDALFAVVPGMVLGAVASLLLVLLGSRPGRGQGGRGLEQRFQDEWRRRDAAEREQQRHQDEPPEQDAAT